jgi:hypothetical protein
VYFDTHTNSVTTQSFASTFIVDSVITDTLSFWDTTGVNVYSGSATSTYTVTVPNTITSYIIEFQLNDMVGGYAWSVDTNSVLLINNPTSINSTMPIRDTLVMNSGSTIDFNISNIQNNGRYQADVTIKHTVDTVFFSSNSTSIKEFDSDRITAYPNPTRDHLNVEGYHGKEFEILDLKGQIIKRGIVTNTIELEQLTKGIYLLRIEDLILKVIKE